MPGISVASGFFLVSLAGTGSAGGLVFAFGASISFLRWVRLVRQPQTSPQIVAQRRLVTRQITLAGQIAGRANDRAITLFDSVGFAIEDFSALRYVLKQLGKQPKSLKFSEDLDMIADPDEPRDLYGMLLRKKATMAA